MTLQHRKKQRPFTLLKGDAYEQLQTLEDESVHAVITDPPYGLSDRLDIEQMLDDWLSGETFVNDANGYAGTEWDHSPPGPELWRQVHRTLVPGGYLLAFTASRTVGLTQLAIQLAGFEIRDLIYWVYSPGRPTGRDQGRRAAEFGDDELAEEMAGFRPTLRPGHEPIVVARKPLDEFSETILDHQLDHGVGLLNHRAITGQSDAIASNVWLVHDLHCTKSKCTCSVTLNPVSQHGTHLYPSDQLGGGALNVAKPRKSERPMSPDGTTHETVKPLTLISTLIKAVTQPGQTVLDPFLGSGTTAEAALLLNRVAIGCELEEDYWPLIDQRVLRALHVITHEAQ
jgi:site-specific DNA-methyltransferase (adenine-specific)